VPRVPVVDGFRAYAILGVVSLHLLLLSGVAQQETTGSLVLWGLLGNVIDVFFIISGFVLFLPVVLRDGELGSLRNFAVGRAARLIPPYWLCIAVMLALIALYPEGLGRGPTPDIPFPSLGDVLGNLAALQMPIRLIDGTFPIGFGFNGALWLLSIIVGFYVVFPLIARSYFRHPFIGLAIAAAITLGWKLLVQEVPEFFQWLDQADTLISSLNASDQLPGWAFSFGLGMTGAWLYVWAARGGPLERFRSKALWVAAFAGVAAAICAYFYGETASGTSFGVIGGSLARTSPALSIAYSLSRAVLLAAIALGPLWLRAPFDNNPVRKVAELSYGVYLIHLVVATYVCGALLLLPTDGSLKAVGSWFAVGLSLSFAFAWLSFRYVEGPSRLWARRYVARNGDRRDPAASRRAEGPGRPSPAR
jgi:peptidoglycan/LPS O-acetylase OafA/YrhL